MLSNVNAAVYTVVRQIGYLIPEFRFDESFQEIDTG